MPTHFRHHHQASDTARETLKELSRRRLVPTPEHFAAVFHELEGTQAESPADASAWRDMLAGTLEFLAKPDAGGEPDGDAASIALRCRNARTEAEARKLLPLVKNLWLRWDLKASDRAEIARGLQALLRLLAENVGELVADEAWMAEQSRIVIELLGQPVTRRSLRETERSLRAVLYRQSARKLTLAEARQSFKEMVAVFAESLEAMGRANGDYQERIAAHRRRLEATNDMHEMRQTVDALLQDTRGLQAAMVRSGEALRAARERAGEHERRVQELETELQSAGALAREDALTGVLNRRGFGEAYSVEQARAARAGNTLAVALLDVDNFKKVNDTFGHATGDTALSHLAQVVRETLRPTDVLARFGGEEFVILLPETEAEEAARVLVRVQRELTRRFFLAADGNKVFITFSAGVALLGPGETREQALERADQALLRAKAAGRNRVMLAEAAPQLVPLPADTPVTPPS